MPELTGNTQTEGREHRERRRLAALALAATNEGNEDGSKQSVCDDQMELYTPFVSSARNKK